MSIRKFKYIIVGGGIVAGYAAQEFIKHPEFKPGDLAIITDDDAIPYERPPLSKDFLAGEENYEDIQINAPEFYRENGIQLFLYTRVNQIDSSEKTIRTDHNDVFGFEKLLLATGSSAIRLDSPGSNNALIKYLRTVEDARSIRNRLDNSNTIIVVGGGYIGMETASALTQDGHQVTMVFPEDRLMERLFTPELSDHFEHYYRDKGVKFIKGETVKEFETKSPKSVQANLSNGDTLDADLIVVGIGAEPNLMLLDGSRINVDGGVIVNNRLQTSEPDIYAAGDIANYFDTIFEKRRRVEHWQNAVDMGRYAAREMLEIEQEDFQTLRYFFSDIFDLSYEFWGDIEGADEVLHVGDFKEAGIGVWWLKSKRLVAAFLLNRSDEERKKAQEWIQEKRTVNPEVFEDSIEVLGQ